MNCRVLIFMLALVPLLQAIYLPLHTNRPRCMMVYTIGEVESVKITLNLPQIPHQTQDEYYSFTMKNTESETTTDQTLQYGTFNREFELAPNVIYEVCVTLVSRRQLDDITIYYKAETVYNIQHSQLKVPDNLLKKEDFKGTYEAAFHIETTLNQYKIMQKERDITSNDHFLQTKAVDKKLITISLIEILIVLGAGIYQFISLKNYLVTRQYI